MDSVQRSTAKAFVLPLFFVDLEVNSCPEMERSIGVYPLSHSLGWHTYRSYALLTLTINLNT